MRNLRTYFSSFTTIVTLCAGNACASHQFAIDSEPSAAEVLLLAPPESPALLGQTPLEIPAESYDPAKPLHLMIRKPGFPDRRVTILSPESQAKVSIGLRRTHDDHEHDIDTALTNANRLIQEGQYVSALQEMRDALRHYGDHAPLYALKGSIHYLLSQHHEARHAWRESLFLDPKNSDVARMLAEL